MGLCFCFPTCRKLPLGKLGNPAADGHLPHTAASHKSHQLQWRGHGLCVNRPTRSPSRRLAGCLPLLLCKHPLKWLKSWGRNIRSAPSGIGKQGAISQTNCWWPLPRLEQPAANTTSSSVTVVVAALPAKQGKGQSRGQEGLFTAPLLLPIHPTDPSCPCSLLPGYEPTTAADAFSLTSF